MINLQAVYHEAKSKFAYMYDQDTLHLRLRTARGDIPKVTLVGGDPFRWKRKENNPDEWEWDQQAAFYQPMRLEYSTELFDYWFTAVKPHWKRIRYGFILEKGDQEILYGSRAFIDLKQKPEQKFSTSNYFNFPYLNFEDVFTAPQWVKDTIWYQIFPERFADGNSSNNPDGVTAWGDDDNENIYNFYGGDLKGVLDSLDYLQELGITGIYFTPIFKSPSSHKYDTTDYYQIDPAFGTNELFKEVVDAAHQRGIRVMLDAVFNHCGWLHAYWQDVIKYGKQSKYYDCFLIHGDPVINFPFEEGKYPTTTPEQRSNLNYSTFAFVPVMPKWNTDHPLVKEHLLGAVRYWTEEYGVDAWRLDVSNEVSHDFWREFRKMVKAINPDVYILGENWDNSNPWLQGDQFDGVMNYELMYPIWNLLGTEAFAFEQFGVTQYQESINKLLVSYPKNNLMYMYNLVDSHDTDRILSVCGGSVDKVKQAYLLQFTFTGAPSIFYGSEVGLGGAKGHFRRCMIWDKNQQNQDLQQFVRRLVQLRKEHPCLQVVDLEWLSVDENQQTFIFKKQTDQESVFVFINHNPEPVRFDLPSEMNGKTTTDGFSGETVVCGSTLTVAGNGCRLLFQTE
ncbi:MAG: alpha-glycosidase [Anaerolineaceae bacterium]|nr:alpha-glycosidase [Anaerolineaceae bacterium]